MAYDRQIAGMHPLSHDRLNVIQIICDQLPYYALGCYGHPMVQTPNIDALARSGVRFANAYAQNPVCMPSRACQLTGLYPSNHGLLANENNLQLTHPWARFLPDRFSQEGYITGQFGKWHCGKDYRACQWDEFQFMEESIPIWPQEKLLGQCPDDPYLLMYNVLLHAATHPCSHENTGPARITDASLSFMERFAYSPFFLRVSYLAPHTPVMVPEPFDTMYDPSDIELPNYPLSEFDNRPQRMIDMQQGCIQNRREQLDGLSPEEATRAHIAYSLGLISHADDQIGRILRKVQQLGLEENTLIIFTADHGGFWGEHGLLEKSPVALYRNLLQIPLIMSLPGTLPEGHVVDGLVEEVDIMPTAMDLAGIEHAYRINGVSQREAMMGHEGACREDVFAEGRTFADGYYAASLRTPDWHLIWHALTDEAELYDEVNDRAERYNLAHDSDKQAIVVQLKSRLLSRMMLNRNVHMMPDDEDLDRTPIYLFPGYPRERHRRAMIAMYKGEPCDEWGFELPGASHQ